MKRKNILIVFIIVSLFFFATIADAGARTSCCAWHGGVEKYTCWHGGIGYRCHDGTSLSPLCGSYYAECSEYTSPQVATKMATSITATSATLEGTLASTGAPTTLEPAHSGSISCQVWLEYGTTTSYGRSTTKESTSSSGTFSKHISGLSPGTTYHFRAVASSSVGNNYGSDRSFETPTPTLPKVTTKDPTGGTYATLNGYLASTGNCVCNVWFEYGATMSYGRSTTKMSKATTGEFSEPISGLTPGTTYHYRAVASNAEGTVYGLVSSFCVLGPPQVTTIAASRISTTSTTLSGNLDSTRCLDCQVWFEYGRTTNYSNSTLGVYKPSPGTFSKHISGLSPETTYHFRAIALNREGIDYGADRSFETSTQKLPLRIGAFNIQVFGKTKAAKGEIMEVLAKIIRTFDVVGIQEIRNKEQTALPKLVNLVNANGTQYVYVVSERLGDTVSKEQYAFFYNNETVNLNGTPWLYPEPKGTNPFHREPLIASFQAVNGSFDATMIVIHVDPDNATEEINALSDVVNFTRDRCPNESDIIIMGNLNADCSYFDEDSNCSICGDDYYWCINNSVDTTTSATNCTYDRIIITSPAVPDYTGISGVFRYDLTYNLKEEETMAVSDHYPIYAEFYCDRDIDTPVKEGYPPLNLSRSDPKLYLIAPITDIAPILHP